VAYFRSILLDEDILTKARLSPTNESFFQFAAAFVASLYTFSYPPSSELSIWKQYMASVPGACQDPFRFDLFLGDAANESSLSWPGDATHQSDL